MGKTMRAFQNSNPLDGRLHKREVPKPVPEGEQVLVKVLAAGVCHSDVTLLDPKLSSNQHGAIYTLGHECCGIVHEMTAAASKKFPQLRLGDIVAVYGCNSCQKETCKMCSTGSMVICPNTTKYGLARDGAYADYILVEARSVVKVPGNLKSTPEVVANVTDAVLTPYRALVRSGIRERANKPFELSACVIGLGGLGNNLLQLLRHAAPKARIVGVDVKAGAVEAAKQTGSADEVYLFEEAEKTLTAEFDFVYDCCGIPSTFLLAQDILGLAGTIMLIGIHENIVPHYTRRNCVKETAVLQTYWGDINELRECLELVSRGVIKPIAKTYPLEDANKIFADFEAGKIIGRAVLIP